MKSSLMRCCSASSGGTCLGQWNRPILGVVRSIVRDALADRSSLACGKTRELVQTDFQGLLFDDRKAIEQRAVTGSIANESSAIVSEKPCRQRPVVPEDRF